MLMLSSAIFGAKDKQKQIVSVKPDPESEFCKQALARFQNTYETKTAHEMNANINTVFYDAAKHKTAMEQEDNELELSWRRRQMNVSTPRGNVIMFYDAFKMGFAYYSDQFMPYKLLNAVAMRYVVMYRCRDFFLDENVVPDNHKSALIPVLYATEQQQNENNIVNNMNMPKDAPFAKLKSQSNTPKIEVAAQSKQTNKFIHVGQVRDYNPLQKSKKVNPLNGFKSDAIPPQIMTYKQYKAKGIQI